MRIKQFCKTILVFCVLAVFAVSCIKQSERVTVPLTSSDTPDPAPQRVTNTVFKDFKHDVPEHTQFACNTCHFRDAEGVKSQLGGHESCIGCHLNEFIAEEQTMCVICHTDTKGSDPPVKAFPAKFIEGFNMKFDHAAHEKGEARPANGCAACHNSSGSGKTIPYGFQAHADCYGCHTAESKLGQCSVCHQLAPYTRTTQSNYAFKAIFTHGDHSGVGCAECHNVRAGAPNAQQVTNIQILEHKTSPGNNCLQCHNGRRSFTGNNPSDCASCVRCHKGVPCKLPAGTYSDTAEEAPATN
jgi:Cytochrome c7 and related cytochrome c